MNKYIISTALVLMFPTVVNAECNCSKVREMRITAYIPANTVGALGTKIRTGGTAAVSRNCMDILGEKVYVEGYGVREVNDLTAAWLDDKFGICTLDLAVPNMEVAKKIGCRTKRVVRLTRYGIDEGTECSCGSNSGSQE